MSVESMLANCRVETIQYVCLGTGTWEGFLPADARRIGLHFPFQVQSTIVLPHTGSAPLIPVPTQTTGYGSGNQTAFFRFPLDGPLVSTDWWILGVAGVKFTYTQTIVIKSLCDEKQEEVPGITWTTNLTQQAVGGTPVGHASSPPDISHIPVAGGFSQALNLAATGGTVSKLQMRQPGPTLASQLQAQQQQALYDAQLKRSQDALVQYQKQSDVASQAAAEAAYYASFGQKPPYNPTLGN